MEMTLAGGSAAAREPLATRMSRMIAWLLVGVVTVQFYTAGLGVFGAAPFDTHRMIGWMSGLLGIALLVVTLVARRGRGIAYSALGCMLLLIFQPILVSMTRSSAPALAAVHPLVGVMIGVLAWRVAMRR